MEAGTCLHWYRPPCKRAWVHASFQSPTSGRLGYSFGFQCWRLYTEGHHTKVQPIVNLIFACGHRATFQTTSWHCYPSSPLESCCFCKTVSPGRTFANLAFSSKTFAKPLKRCLGPVNVRSTSTFCLTFLPLLKCGDPYGNPVTYQTFHFVFCTYHSFFFV